MNVKISHKDNKLLQDNITFFRKYLVSQEVKLKYNSSIKQKIFDDLNLEIYENEIVDNREIIYAYSNKFNKFLMYQNKKINFQIVICNSTLIIGYPIIYSGF